MLTAEGGESDMVLGLGNWARTTTSKKPFSVRESPARAEVLPRRRRAGEPNRWTFGD